MTRFLLALALLTLVGEQACTSGGPFRKRLVFERQQLQEKVAAKFPLKKRKALIATTFSKPRVILAEGAERMGIALAIEVSAPGVKYGGEIEADGEIHYRPRRGEFSVVNCRIRRLEVEDLPEKYQKLVHTLAEKVVELYLSDLPVYRLDQGNFKQSLAKLVLKSVNIENGQLVVIVGL